MFHCLLHSLTNVKVSSGKPIRRSAISDWIPSSRCNWRHCWGGSLSSCCGCGPCIRHCWSKCWCHHWYWLRWTQFSTWWDVNVYFTFWFSVVCFWKMPWSIVSQMIYMALPKLTVSHVHQVCEWSQCLNDFSWNPVWTRTEILHHHWLSHTESSWTGMLVTELFLSILLLANSFLKIWLQKVPPCTKTPAHQ